MLPLNIPDHRSVQETLHRLTTVTVITLFHGPFFIWLAMTRNVLKDGMMTGRHHCRAWLVLATFTALAACSSGGNDGAPGGTGSVSLAVSDSPVSGATHVCVAFDEVEFKKAGSDNVVIEVGPVSVNLLDFQGMNAADLIVAEPLEAGDYQWVRLGVIHNDMNHGNGAAAGDDGCTGPGSYIIVDEGGLNDGPHPLRIPSGDESGLKLNRGFTVDVAGQTNLVAEFDLMKSVRPPPGQSPFYLLRPVVHLTGRGETGSIAGEVDMTLATQADCMPAVYLYQAGELADDNEDEDVDPTDAVDPLASAIVSMDTDGIYRYEIGPLLPGMYDLYFSCDEDRAGDNDMLDYLASEDNTVEVTAGEESVANFVPTM